MATYFRKLFADSRSSARRAGMLLLVLLGFTASAAAHTPIGDTINDRVTRIRVRLQEEQPQAVASLTAPSDRADVDQWGNWGNWNNWRNWANWNNWRNWGNWGNWINY
jgi:hypothetical protein